jgi:hypothetical protein
MYYVWYGGVTELFRKSSESKDRDMILDGSVRTLVSVPERLSANRTIFDRLNCVGFSLMARHVRGKFKIWD